MLRYEAFTQTTGDPAVFRELLCSFVPTIIDLDAGWTITHSGRSAQRLGSFGATATLVVPPESDQTPAHAEARVGTGLVMVDDADRDSPFCLPGPVVVYAVVDDPDSLHDQDYGSREFAARDPYGNVWSFGTYRPSLDTQVG
ncbi:VOC family protein [soil metagenome]